MDANLVHVKPDGSTVSAPIKPGRSIIGREAGTQIRIPLSDVSRKHCELTLDDDGLRIRDLGSSNGTFVNHRQIDDAALSAGDVLTIGDHSFVIQINGTPEQIDASSLRVGSHDAKPYAGPDAKPEAAPAAGAPSAPAGSGSVLDELDLPSSDDSSFADFDFDLDDDDDEPKL